MPRHAMRVTDVVGEQEHFKYVREEEFEKGRGKGKVRVEVEGRHLIYFGLRQKYC